MKQQVRSFNPSTLMHSAWLLLGTLSVSGCYLINPPDTSHVKQITAEQAEHCQALSGELTDRNSHAFHHDDNVLRVLDEAKIKTVRKNGNAFVAIKHTMSFEHNTSKLVYQVYDCPEDLK